MPDNFIGTWEIASISGACNLENYGLERVRFRLDETGDVTWTVSKEFETVPLFMCETYEIYSTTAMGLNICFGAYAGHVIKFKVSVIEPKGDISLTCDEWGTLHCKKVLEEPKDTILNTTFSLLPALEDGYFSDIKIIAANTKEFKIHSCIAQLQGNDIPWHSNPPPFSGLSEEVLGTILHFLYAECLPSTLTEATAQEVIKISSQYTSLSRLVDMCQVYLKNMALKQQIIGLVNDMHCCFNQIIEYFSPKHNSSPTENITSNPAKLCFVVKQSIREGAVAVVKLLLLCDLFTKCKKELSKEERHEIVHYAKSRLPIFLSQLHQFLEALESTFNSMSASQRQEIATYLVPETEVILDTISMLIVELEKALQQIIEVLSPHDNSRGISGVADILGKSLRNVLHIRELTKLRNFHEHLMCSLELLLHKKENFNEMSPPQKVRSVARNLEQLIEELPMFLQRLEETMEALEDRLEWIDFKFSFKIGTSKASCVLQKLVAHKEVLQEVMLQICELVQRDTFTQSLHTLGILNTGAISTHSEESQGMKKSSSFSIPKQQHEYKLNLVETLCMPPSANNSTLSKLSLQLLQSGADTDMEFEIICPATECSAENGDDAAALPNEDERAVIKAHRVIVAARCDWFRRALLSGMREAIDKKIIIHDTNPLLFRTLLEYLYSGRLRKSCLNTDQLVDLILLSDRYEVDPLKQACEYALKSSIDQDSVLYFLSIADQFNAQTLKNACLNYISQHQELTDTEVFYELPIVLQAEVFDCVWTQPPPRKSTTMEQLLPTSATPTSTDSSMSDVQRAMCQMHMNPEMGHSNSSSLEDLPLSHDPARLDACIAQLRDILGERAARETLVQVVLAADYDLGRAINYFYGHNNPEN